MATLHLNNQQKHYLALGDSYTIGEAVPEAASFPFQTVHLLRQAGLNFGRPDIIAVTGWTTGDLMQAIQGAGRKIPYDVVSLLIGVNNQYQGRSMVEYAGEFSDLLEKSIALAGGHASHVFVLSIPDYSVTPFARNRDRRLIANAIDLFNGINRKIADSYKVNYSDITAVSRNAENDPGLIAADGLHYSGREYAIWAGILAGCIKSALQQ